MTVEISSPGGINFEEQLSEKNFEAFLLALPNVYKKENIKLFQTEDGKVGLGLKEYETAIYFDVLSEVEELKREDYDLEDGIVVQLSMYLLSLVDENDSPVEEDYMLTYVIELSDILKEKYPLREVGYLYSEENKIFLNHDLTDTPQLKTIIDSISAMIEFAKAKGEIFEIFKNSI